MEKEKISNQQKYENYKEQFKRLNRSLANGFNLEAMFIEYSIIEDRTESVLRHAGLWDKYMKRQRNGRATLNSKIKYISNCAKSGISFLEQYFSDGLLDEIIIWKEDRNRLIHALLEQEFRHNEVSEIAEKGNQLVRSLRTRVTSYNRMIDLKKESVGRIGI